MPPRTFTRAELLQHFQTVNGRPPSDSEMAALAQSAGGIATTVAISKGSDQGRQYDHAAGLQRVYQDAIAAGLPPEGARAAVAIAQTEGGMGGAEGDKALGGSAGTFQAFFGGGQGNNYAKMLGISEAQAKQQLRDDPHSANAWALKGYLGNAIKTGLANGLTGAELATFAQRTGQVSESPERAGQNYATLYGGDSPASRERQQFIEANTDLPGGSPSSPPPPSVTATVAATLPKPYDAADDPEMQRIQSYITNMHEYERRSKNTQAQFGEPLDVPQFRMPGLPQLPSFGQPFPVPRRPRYVLG